ncbi:MAG TPA: AAA family ATPase [Oculatellaceae cyanobacterium]
MTTRQKILVWLLVIVPLIAGTIAIFGPTDPAGITTPRLARVRTIAHPLTTAQSATAAVTSRNEPRKSAAPPGDMQVSDLYERLASDPASLSSLTFLNGANTVIVHLKDGGTPSVKMPDGSEQSLFSAALTAKVPFEAKDAPVSRLELLRTFGPFLIGIALMVFIMFRGGMLGFKGASDNGGLGKLGSSKAKDFKSLAEGQKVLTFDDIAGCDEAVSHMKRVVRWQKYRRIYELCGAKPPRGYVISGPPGGGKTLMVRIVAFQIDADVHLTSGSDFDEMLVGVGASRVRGMFDKAIKQYEETKRPQIIIIDEIDAVGGKRNQHGNTGTEPTLNAMLVQLDGVLENKGIIVIGLTNRPDMLDEALTRPGRLEYHITIDEPDTAGREAIAKIHARGKPVAADATPRWVAELTYNFSGAKIAMVYNHAAILAAEDIVDGEGEVQELVKAPADVITRKHLMKAIDLVLFGDENTAKQANTREQDKINTMVHELGGHALSADTLKEFVDQVGKVTIARHRRALGFVSFRPDHDRTGWTKEQALARIIVAMAGRVAQEHYLGVCDSGARGDFQQATDYAREMVMSWGMSSVGKLGLGTRDDGRQVSIGAWLQNKVDREVVRITNECYEAAVTIVRANDERFKMFAPLLMESERFEADEWEELTRKHPNTFDVSSLAMFADARRPVKTLEEILK